MHSVKRVWKDNFFGVVLRTRLELPTPHQPYGRQSLGLEQEEDNEKNRMEFFGTDTDKLIPVLEDMNTNQPGTLTTQQNA